MSLAEQSLAVTASEQPRWSLAPQVTRVEELDATLRGRLAKSLEHIGEVAGETIDQDALRVLVSRLGRAAVSPWVFCLYSRLVAELSKSPAPGADDDFAAVIAASKLDAEQGAVAFADPALPPLWWDHFRVLLDTDRQRPFSPRVPRDDDYRACAGSVQEGFALLARAEPAFHDEAKALLRVIVLAAPPGPDPQESFDGASTFFFWGGTLLNANLSRHAVAMVELLVHEASHVLLFGLASDGGLLRNPGNDRFASPLRRDKRPLEGIFHAAFVTTRVHLALTGMLANGKLSENERSAALMAAERNANAARASLDLLREHAEPTKLGDSILDMIEGYWTKAV